MNLVVNRDYLHDGMICYLLEHGLLIFTTIFSCVSNASTKCAALSCNVRRSTCLVVHEESVPGI
jgi:hypothetical protein